MINFVVAALASIGFIVVVFGVIAICCKIMDAFAVLSQLEKDVSQLQRDVRKLLDRTKKG